MSSFKSIQEQVAIILNLLFKDHTTLYLTDVTKEQLWNTYYGSFPSEYNQLFRERPVHDCNACRHFIQRYGNIVAIDQNNNLISIWDMIEDAGDEYQPSVNAMRRLVKSAPIRDAFYTYERQLGVKCNHSTHEGQVETFDHLYAEVPKSHNCIVPKIMIPTYQGNHRTERATFRRAMDEITTEAIQTVLELIAQGSLYRGEEHKKKVQSLQKVHKEYHNTPDDLRSNYCWANKNVDNGVVSTIRNSAIGTLLIDLSNDRDLEEAIRAFEIIMAPANYQRPKPVYTKRMIEDARKKVEELGLSGALHRRHATIDDIKVNNVLFLDRDVKAVINKSVFDSLGDSVSTSPKKFSKVEEIHIDKFIKDVLPDVDHMELLFEGSHENNMVNLVAPIDGNDDNKLFKWDNNFSWTYQNNLTDSIKDKVRKAGGDVTGDVRISLSWFNTDDLDLHVKEPKHYIYYNTKMSPSTGGTLDVDMNVHGETTDPVENVTYPTRNKMIDGDYKVIVNQFHHRNNNDVGFTLEVEIDGNIHTFNYELPVLHKKDVKVCTITKAGNELKVTPILKNGSVKSRDIWNLKTNKFYPVKLLTLSPNHWDNNEVGNKHYFFMLSGAHNDETDVRGFFNEYLRSDLHVHRKVFEALGTKLSIEPSRDQLAGVGFSSTYRNAVVLQVQGSISRTLKIIF